MAQVLLGRRISWRSKRLLTCPPEFVGRGHRRNQSTCRRIIILGATRLISICHESYHHSEINNSGRSGMVLQI
jgi:hypothetical protein